MTKIKTSLNILIRIIEHNNRLPDHLFSVDYALTMILRTVYRATVTDKREVNLNLIHLQGIVEIDVETVVDIFIKSGKRRIMQNLPPNKFFSRT